MPADATASVEDAQIKDAEDSDAGFLGDTGHLVDTGTSSPAPTLDEMLTELLAKQEHPPEAMDAPPSVSDEQYELGRMLFFDPILSGNKDVACVSCHDPDYGSSDGLSLAIGTGATGRGPERINGRPPDFVARHSIDLFNRGDASIHTLFWDGRITRTSSAGLRGPLPLPSGLSGPLAAQALFPILDRVEMRGFSGQQTVTSEANELALYDDEQSSQIWAAITARILAIPEYAQLFTAAYPATPQNQISITQVVNAIAAFETRAFAATNTPWDQYLRGDLNAISSAQKIGALFFYGSAKCGNCHSGALLSDQKFHNTAIPQIGPGKPGTQPLDHGQEHATQDENDRFKFRTPPLRNVMHTAPYMHNGSLVDLDALLRHYAQPESTARNYDSSDLHLDLQSMIHNDEATLTALTSSISEDVLVTSNGVSFIGLSNLRQFMHALTDPTLAELGNIRPSTVPSGLSLP